MIGEGWQTVRLFTFPGPLRLHLGNCLAWQAQIGKEEEIWVLLI
jgi:hypothetical protein